MGNNGNKSYWLINMQEILQVGGNVSSYGGFILFDNYNEKVKGAVHDSPLTSLPLKMQTYTLMICREGYFEYRLDCDRPLCIREGDLFFFQYGQIIEFISAADNSKVLFITVSKENMDNLLHFVPHEYLSLSQPLKLTDALMDEIQLYYKMMRNQIDSPGQHVHENILRAYMYIILMKLGCDSNRHHSASNRIDTASVRKADIYHRFVIEVKANFKRHRDIEFYASSLFLSAGHLSRVIKAISGKTAGGYIRDYVILEAKVMLQTSNLSISQISDDLNFPNPSFFSKYFRESTGMTPGQYRKSYKRGPVSNI